MRIAWQLPGAFPDLYWLHRWLISDVMVLDDVAPFNRKSHVHRGKIRTPDGQQWIYFPIHPDDRKIPLHQARTDNTTDWVTPLLRALAYNYRNSVYFDHYEPEIIQDFHKAAGYEYYLDAISYLNSRLWSYLQIEPAPNIIKFSETDGLTLLSDNKATDQLLILPERKSLNYLNIPTKNNVAIREELDHHSSYRQHFGGFMDGCCLYDVLFEEGPEFWRILEQIRIIS